MLTKSINVRCSGATPDGSVRLAPDQTDRRSRLPRVFSDPWPEARHPPRRPCGLPHGLGVGDPSPCAPPFRAGCSVYLRILRGFGVWGHPRVQVSLEHERFVWGQGEYVRGPPLTCTFGPFSCIRKGTRRAGPNTPHPLPPDGGISISLLDNVRIAGYNKDKRRCYRQTVSPLKCLWK